MATTKGKPDTATVSTLDELKRAAAAFLEEHVNTSHLANIVNHVRELRDRLERDAGGF
jgi:hypothetical protein